MYASVKWEETVWHGNSLNTTMQKKSHSRNWRIHVSFTQRVLHVCVAIQRNAHRTRYTHWAVECTVHAEESQICEKYTVYPRRRIVRNITADSSVLHVAERDNIRDIFSTTKHAYYARETLYDWNAPFIQINKMSSEQNALKLHRHGIMKRAPDTIYTFLID